MMCKVSVIIGVYNGEATIATTLESIIKQNFDDYEIIICDDCSTDNTMSVLNKYGKKYPERILILENKSNLHLAATLNHCLMNANGEYIARIDADDIMYTNRLSEQTKFLDSNLNIDCVGSNIDVYNGNSITRKQHYPEHPTLHTLVTGKYPFAHPSIMIRRKCLSSLKGYNNDSLCNRCEDLDLWYRFFIMCFHGYNIQKCLTRYTETMNDYEKRNLKMSLLAYKVRHHYRKAVSAPWYYDILYFRSICFSLLPKQIRYVIKNNIEF